MHCSVGGVIRVGVVLSSFSSAHDGISRIASMIMYFIASPYLHINAPPRHP